jgi:hypothetical protein
MNGSNCTADGQGSPPTFDLDNGDLVTVTCDPPTPRAPGTAAGRVTLVVQSGTVETGFTLSDGTPASTVLAAGNGVAFESATASFTAPATNIDDILVEVGGQDYALAPGETVTLDAGPSCSDTLAFDRCKLKPKFRKTASKTDKLTVSCKVLDASAAVAGIDPSAEQILLTLDDSGGTCFTAAVDPADCLEKKGTFKCKPPRGSTPFVQAKLRPDRRNPGSYKLKFKAKSVDMQCLDPAETPWTMGLSVGDDCGQVNCPSTGKRIECPGP